MSPIPRPLQLTYNPDERTVTVQAGVRYAEIITRISLVMREFRAAVPLLLVAVSNARRGADTERGRFVLRHAGVLANGADLRGFRLFGPPGVRRVVWG